MIYFDMDGVLCDFDVNINRWRQAGGIGILFASG